MVKSSSLNSGERISIYLNRDYDRRISNKSYVWLFMRHVVNKEMGEGSTQSMNEEDLWGEYCRLTNYGEKYKDLVHMEALHDFIDLPFLTGA